MKHRVRWAASALDCLLGILDFTAKESPAAAHRTVDEILERVEVLEDHPRIGPVFSEESGPNIRRLILGHYIVVYQIRETSRTIFVVAVRHGRQRPLTMADLEDEIL